MSGSGYAIGLAIASYEWMAAITLILVGKFLLPVFLKTGIYTMPQFLEQRYDHRVRTVMASFWLGVYVFVNLTSILWLGALAINTVAGVDLTLGLVLLGLFAVSYSLYGGLKAVALTDIVQVVLLVAGGLMIAVILLEKVSGGTGVVNGFITLMDTVPDRFDMILAKDHPHYKAPLGKNQGRGVASGFWFNGGMQSSASVNVNDDGTVSLVSGNPDIGGSRASLAIMAAEEFGIDVDRVDPQIADTNAVGYSDLTGGSRVTFATGMAVVEASRECIQQLRQRAASIWGIEIDDVEWSEGHARATNGNADLEPLSLGDIALKAARTGGPISGQASLTARGVGMAFGVHICDVEVDEETGKVDVVRYTAVQDAGRAIHPSYVEGQMQGGAAQGIGWALNEEYIYDESGVMENPGFLDYRVPVASDLPMIDTVIVEVPNPNHPYGVRGVGEVPIVPPIPAVANAIHAATGVRMRELPMSPPKVLAALESSRA